MTRILRDRGCQVVAIEIDAEMSAQAEPYCERVILGDLDHMDLEAKLGQDQFDVIVAADVLEHLKDPAAVLRAIKKRLRPGGYLVLSVPNVAHGSVRLALLQGRFDYTDLGLLDRTHLRFFTRQTIVELLRDAGFAVGHLECQELMIDRGEVSFDMNQLSSELLDGLSKDVEARTYQFILVAYPLPWPGMDWLHQRFMEWAEQEQHLQRELTQSHEVAAHKVQAAAHEASEARERACRQVAEANEAAIRQLIASKEAWQMEKDGLVAKIDNLTRDVASARRLCDEKESVIRELGAIKEAWTAELQQARDTAKAEVDAALSQCRLVADQEKEELLARFEVVALREKELRANLLDAHDQLLRRDSEFDSLLRDMHVQQDQLIAERSDVVGQLGRLSQELDHRARERDSFLAQQQDLESRLVGGEVELCHINAERNALIEEGERSRAEMDRLQSRLAQIRSSLPGRLYVGMRHIYRGFRRLASRS
jgi:SAM-dependent methyltransferase